MFAQRIVLYIDENRPVCRDYYFPFPASGRIPCNKIAFCQLCEIIRQHTLAETAPYWGA
jgi:hypothetical protein